MSAGGGPGLEIERKYLIRMPDAALLRRQPGCVEWEIEQTYLTDPAPGCTRRVRRIRTGAEMKYVYTGKQRVSSMSCREEERALSGGEYAALLREADPARNAVCKRRYRIPYAGQLLEVDIYAFWDDRATLEIELEREDQPVRLPEYLDVVRELTGDRAYTNHQLAKTVPHELLPPAGICRDIQKTVPEALQRFFAGHPRIALAFSGGCDSAYLFYAATVCGAEVGAYYVQTEFQPAFEQEDARRLAQQLNKPLHLLSASALADERVRANPADRCYYCKQGIFGRLMRAARADGFEVIMDGTNASDDAGDRPGMRALRELEVVSPLRSCGISKAQVRALSRAAGLFTWNKPAYACLATRIPTGTPIEPERLQAVERAETQMAALGFSDFRVRATGARGARLELTQPQMALLLEKRAELLKLLGTDFSEITLNLQPRRESV